jgi:hypothetical protein
MGYSPRERVGVRVAHFLNSINAGVIEVRVTAFQKYLPLCVGS